ncbi:MULTISPECIES: hypothetical protein [unclassified Providencia]|uniref:hypothetical protein n=1 Tax=unclassified Providencia TaxID=2633465 RepID=UPI00234B633D|nr:MULTISPECIES: hypothetical protein [unclassified Providencia]WOB99300.1 hypothetical protein P3L55_18880 [Providencia sp. PROV046]
MKALAIFGSTARNEREFDSDIDMIGIYEGSIIKSVNHANVSLFLYPEKVLNEKMLSGDLFALHLVKESIPIFGEETLNKIYSRFKYKDSYREEMDTSLMLAFKILNLYEELTVFNEANKKLVWSLRTFIISISAQDQTPVFSKKLIAGYLKLLSINSESILRLINMKSMKSKLPKCILNEFKSLFDELYVKFGSKHLLANESLINDIIDGIKCSDKVSDY